MRLLGFAALVLVAFALLRQVPVLGNNFLALWVSVIAVSVGLSWLGDRALVRRRVRSQIRTLEQVDSPHNRGKLGSLYLSLGRPREAVPHLAEAWTREPETIEWAYRLGCAHLSVGAVDEAAEALREVTAVDEEYAYGAAQMRLVEALSTRARRRESLDGPRGHEQALAALDVFERNHGESPESAFRRGRLLRALGRREDARRSFARVGELAQRAARYQRREAAGWATRAALARLL